MALALACAVTGCAGSTAPAAPKPGCPPRPDTARDHFPRHAALRYARNVSFQYTRGYLLVTVHQPYPGGAAESTVLLPCGVPRSVIPPSLAGDPVVTIPVHGLYAASTTELPSLVDLGELGTLAGVGTPNLVSSPAVAARIRSGRVVGFAANGQVDVETVVAHAPDVLLGEGVDDPAYRSLRAAGVPVLQWADYLDGGPLAAAEWVKVTGALTGRDTEAAAVFDRIERQYRAVAGAASAAQPVPVIVGQPHQGMWAVPAGGGTAGVLLKDAGASWSGAASPATGSLPLGLEAVLSADGNARVWLADGPWRTRADALATDPRLSQLAATGPGGQIWTRDLRTAPGGGNDVFERGVAHPDEVLADLVAILHPGLEPGHRFVYYRRVGP